MEMDFSKMCRTCMCEGQTMFPLFSTTKDLSSFPEMIMTITSVRVMESDGLPCQVCVQCVTSLDSAINFKALCEKSDSLFREHISSKASTQHLISGQVKQEVSAENFESHLELEPDYEDNFMMYKAEPEVELTEEKPIINPEITEQCNPAKVSKVHVCNVCGKAYVAIKSLKRHMAIHKGDGYNCNQCKKVFSRRDHIRKHLLRIHCVKDIEAVMNSITLKEVVKYDCQYCNVDAPNKVSMAKHMRACHKDKLPKRKNSASNNYEAFMSDGNEEEDDNNDDDEDDDDDDDDDPDPDPDPDPDSEIDTRRTVGLVAASGGGAVATIKEEKGEHGDSSRLVLEVRYHCAMCGAQYQSQHSYAAHMTKHSGPVPKGQTHFRCNICEKIFTKRKNLRQHALIHNKEKANKCTLCHRAFTRPDQLILHMNNHTGIKRHQCSHCDKGFNMLSTLKDHLRTHSGEKPFLCSICGKGFTQNTNLKQHLMRHSAIKPFSCPQCHAKFVSKGELDAHLRKHTGDHPFVCDTCGTGFTTSSSLVKHKRIHSGERPYACDLCQLRFTALGTLKNHRRTHTGEKPFACTNCTRAFAQKSDLVSHIRTHTGERPYVCPTCRASYQQSSALKAHIKAHHPLVNKTPSNEVVETHSTRSSDHDTCPVQSYSRKYTESLQGATNQYKATPENSQSPHSEMVDHKFQIE